MTRTPAGPATGSAPPEVEHAEPDPVAVAASGIISGPRGRYAAPHRNLRAVAAKYAALTAIPLAAGASLQQHCINAGWNTPDQFWHMCFSDLANTYGDARMSGGLGAFLAGGVTAPAPSQPPLTALVMTALASLVPSGTALGQTRWYMFLWAVVIAALFAAISVLTAVTVRRSPQRAALVALSPLVALLAFISPDPLGVALVALGIYLWVRGRVVGAGVVLGLAIAARTYPVLILVAVALLALRAGRLRVAGRLAAIALGTAALVFAALYVVNPDGAMAAYSTWAGAGAGFGSPWVLPTLSGSPLPASAVDALTVFGWFAAVIVGALLALGAQVRPPVWEVAAVMLGIVLVTGSSFPVQASLWLVPLVALTGLPWRDILIWTFAEGMHWVAVWLHVAAQSVPDRGLPAGWYAMFLIIRLAAVVYITRQVWHRSMSRRHEWPAVASPDDGPLAGLPDRVLVAFQ